RADVGTMWEKFSTPRLRAGSSSLTLLAPKIADGSRSAPRWTPKDRPFPDRVGRDVGCDEELHVPRLPLGERLGSEQAQASEEHRPDGTVSPSTPHRSRWESGRRGDRRWRPSAGCELVDP